VHWEGAVGQITRNEKIIRLQEALALRMLEKVNKDETTLDLQLDTFEKVGKWVAIRNKVEDQEETQIDRFKRRIAGEDETSEGKQYPPSRRPKGYKPRQPRLEALRSRVSGANDSSSIGDSNGTGGEVAAVVE
jgi:hypothetical protein